MPTINQLIKKGRKNKKTKSKSPVLLYSINKLKNNKKSHKPAPFKYDANPVDGRQKSRSLYGTKRSKK